jgi:hypothetical protein
MLGADVQEVRVLSSSWLWCRAFAGRARDVRAASLGALATHGGRIAGRAPDARATSLGAFATHGPPAPGGLALIALAARVWWTRPLIAFAARTWWTRL